MAYITVDSVTKKYEARDRNAKGIKKLFIKNKEFTAVDKLSFQVEKGEALGLIGPNGAGKSTTIKMLTGILTPTEGDIIVGGMRPWKQRKRFVKNIGVVFGQRSQLWWDLPVEDSYKLLQKVYNISRTDYDNNILLFDELLQMGELLKKPVRQLSLGQRMRCEVAAAFLHNPELVFLDEPTIGLDVIAKENIRSFIKKVNNEKQVTIILTSHDLVDIQEICERIIVIDKGTVVYQGMVEGVGDSYGKKRNIHLELADKVLLNIPNVTIEKENGKQLDISFDLDEISMKEVMNIISGKSEILDMKVSGTSIEQIVKDLYQQKNVSE